MEDTILIDCPDFGVHYNLSVNSYMVSDGLACFAAVKDGCQHTRIVTGEGLGRVSLEFFTWVNTMISNVKRSMNGAYHAINHKHLPRYLAEFCYRFNRRFVLEDMLPRLFYVAARTTLILMRLLKLAEIYSYQDRFCTTVKSVSNRYTFYCCTDNYLHKK